MSTSKIYSVESIVELTQNAATISIFISLVHSTFTRTLFLDNFNVEKIMKDDSDSIMKMIGQIQ